MATETTVQRDIGHPWDGRPGFDILHLEADTQEEIDVLVKRAKEKFWGTWLIGINEETGLLGGAMYKPCDANSPWEDSPDKPHPGNVREVKPSPRPKI